MSLTKQTFDDMNERFPTDDEHKENRKIRTTDELKRRVIEVKKKLPTGIVPIFISKYPKFDNDKGRKKITNVIQLRIADVEITSKLESLAKLLSPESKK